MQGAARVALVGCGNIGSRLLQSAARMGAERIDVVEPSRRAREIALARHAEAAPDARAPRFVERAEQLEGPYDLGIVATDARNRLGATRALLAAAEHRAVLLEKVLFTRNDEFDAALDLACAHGTPFAVNCSRNEWPGYLALTRRTLDEGLEALDVEGADWSMGCNAIHFLALAERLAGTPVARVEWEGPARTREAKRTGYAEVTGTLRASLGDGSRVRLSSAAQGGGPLSVTVRTTRARYTIDEANGTIARGRAAPEPFLTLRASELDRAFARLVGGASALPSLDESARTHRALFEALNEAFHGERTLAVECPVT